MNVKKLLIWLASIFLIVVVGFIIMFYIASKKNDLSSGDGSTFEKGDVAGVTTQDSVQDKAWVEGLAKALSEKGMVLYGAYWCGHCNNQKKLFGDAVKYIDYVECDPSGENSNTEECSANDIEGYPTWVYQGQKYAGERSLEKLAQIIGYK